MSAYRNSFPIIYTRDLPTAVAFYRDRLGFAETYRFPPEGTQPEFVSLRLPDGAGLALAAARDGEPGAHGLPVRPGGGPQFELCVYTDDVDRAIADLDAHGVPVLVPPADQPWGERMAYVADPDGRPVMICAPR